MNTSISASIAKPWDSTLTDLVFSPFAPQPVSKDHKEILVVRIQT